MQLGEAHMRFNYANSFGGPEQALDPYERLIHDVMVGHRTFFTTSEGIERLWEVGEPLLRDPPPTESYEQGSWGPQAADALISPHTWHLPSGHI
jgi:glucose-6-phosphate 1-dehydrogenase